MSDLIRPTPDVTVSIVSHGHGAMVWALVDRVLALPDAPALVVTLNIPEPVPEGLDSRVTVIRNVQPKGFGANHNAAFLHCTSPYFCVLNPDIELMGDPFPALCSALRSGGAGLCAPLVLGPDQAVEDSVREFMTPWRMVLRKLGMATRGTELEIGGPPVYPDWVAGMFMLFDAAVYRRVGGFDASYFMYCEDADICTRLWQDDVCVLVCPAVQVIHHAQRASRRDFRHLRWHLASMFRYVARYWGRLPRSSGPL
jgi:N-acetylglucosaminyl-diphospho-decaprenol L-rhamnosyltransferase